MFTSIVERVIIHTVRSENKGKIINSIVSALRLVARQRCMISFIAGYIGSSLHNIGEKKESPTRIRLLVLNEERYLPDLNVLKEHPEIELIGLPSPVQHLINAMWVSEIRDLTEKDPDAYLRNDDPDVLRVRTNLHNYLCLLIKDLAVKYKIDGMTSCTFYYRQDREWESAGHQIGVPFFALHKENMQDPVIQEKSITRYRNKHYKFTGDRIFLFNRLIKGVLERAGCCTRDQVSIVGALRMDNIYKRVKSHKIKATKRQIVLFSFHHRIGLLEIPGVDGFFNRKNRDGFIDYFDLVHGTVAKFANDNPDVAVFIKPKWMGEGWAEEIYNAVKRVTGLNANDIPNLSITDKIPAQELIENSKVVIGINSTTLLEAKLFGRAVVMPLFAEASEKYFNTNVYFHKYLDDVFNTVRSPDELEKALTAELNETAIKRTISDEMIADYLGFFDGQVTERILSIMKQDIANAQTRRDW